MAKDHIGQEFTVGDYVFYAVSSGSSAVVKFALVVKDEHKQQLVNRYNSSTRGTQQVMEDVYKVGVQEILANGRAYRLWDSAAGKSIPGKARTSYPSVTSMLKASPELIEICLAINE